jgi:hypothetical protein
MRYTVDMTSDDMTYIPSLMKTAFGIQVMLRLLPDNLRGCSVSATYDIDF